REAARLAGGHIPRRGVRYRGPRPPRLRRVEDPEAGPDFAVRARLTQEVTLQPRVVTHSASIALAWMQEDRAALAHVPRPGRAAVTPRLPKELVSLAFPDTVLRHSSQDDAVGRLVGAVRIVRIDVYVVVAGDSVVRAEVEEGRAAEAGCELPVAP